MISRGPDIREIAFVALCRALGGKHIALLPKDFLESNKVVNTVKDEFQGSEEIRFMSYLSMGAHFKGNDTDSAPQETIYWLEDVLVLFLPHFQGAMSVPAEQSHIDSYCREHCPDQCVDAVLMCIEHVALARGLSVKEVQ